MGEKDYKALILKSAGEIINQQGIKKLTVANVVKLSKISNRNFYECFSSKEELLEELKRMLNGEGVEIPDERQILLKKAEQGISRYGFNNITLETIAASAGLKRSVIYKYFSDKYELLEYCIEYQFEQIKKIIVMIYEENETNPEGFFRNYIENYSYFINSSLESSLYTEGWSHLNYRDKIRQVMLDVQEHLREYLKRGLLKGIEQGTFKKDLDLEAVTDFMLMTLNGMAFFLSEDRNRIRVRKKTVDMILELFLKEMKVS